MKPLNLKQTLGCYLVAVLIGLAFAPKGIAQNSDIISPDDLARLRAFIQDSKLGSSAQSEAVAQQLVNGVYVVKPGDTLGHIMSTYLVGTGVNQKVLEQVIVRANKKAFRRGNPHWIMAGAKLRMPTAADLMDYVAPGSASLREGMADDWVRFP